MKSLISRSFSPGCLAALISASVVALSASAQDTPPAPPSPPAPEPPPASVSISGPGGIIPGSPLSQVLKLTQAGVDEGVIQTYVTNSASTFNLDSDKIIFLKDAGVPDDLVTMMMQHDTVVQAQIAAANSPPASSAYPTPPPLEAPVTNYDQTADVQSPDTAPPDTGVSVDEFYSDLAPYGSWVTVEGYGYCWVPGVTIYHHDWQPYGDHGHWIYTDYGWYWVSDYSWGWAPFHYGRWLHNPRFGWCWRPDTNWGPSWVTWRYSDDYCGWAPLPPGAIYQDGIGLFYNGIPVDAGFDFGLSEDSFVFVATANFTSPHPYQHHLGHDQAALAYHSSTVVNGIIHGVKGVVNYGINPAQISQASHTPVRTVMLHNNPGTPGPSPGNGHLARYSAGYANDSGTTAARNTQNYPAAQSRQAPAVGWQNGQRTAPTWPSQGAYASQAPVQWQRPLVIDSRAPAPVSEMRPGQPSPYYQPPEPQRPMYPYQAQEPRPEMPVPGGMAQRMEPAPAPVPQAPQGVRSGSPQSSSSSSSSSSQSAGYNQVRGSH